jgi:hypothetical protein
MKRRAVRARREADEFELWGVTYHFVTDPARRRRPPGSSQSRRAGVRIAPGEVGGSGEASMAATNARPSFFGTGTPRSLGVSPDSQSAAVAPTIYPGALDRLIDLLEKKETIDGSEIDAILKSSRIPPGDRRPQNPTTRTR